MGAGGGLSGHLCLDAAAVWLDSAPALPSLEGQLGYRSTARLPAVLAPPAPDRRPQYFKELFRGPLIEAGRLYHLRF